MTFKMERIDILVMMLAALDHNYPQDFRPEVLWKPCYNYHKSKARLTIAGLGPLLPTIGRLNVC
jgi:hypothetical protein